MSCNCKPKPEIDPIDQELGGSLVTTPVPLSNGLSIPTFGVLRGYDYFYTRCTRLSRSDAVLPLEFIQISKKDEELNYFQETLILGVESYPESTLMIPAGVDWEKVDSSHWRIYPNPKAKEFYVLLEYVEDSVNEESVSAHYNVTLVGYNSNDTVPFDITLSVVAGDKSADFMLSLDEPYLNLSDHDIWLIPGNNNMNSVALESNLQWRFVF